MAFIRSGWSQSLSIPEDEYVYEDEDGYYHYDTKLTVNYETQ